MDTISRLGSTAALLAACGCASIEPAEPASVHLDQTSIARLAEPAGGAGPGEAPSAATFAARAETTLPDPAERTAAAPVGEAGGRRTASGRRLTTRQKRIFVLGLAAQESK
ncbi:MAG: hypothetical protein ACYTJ0_10320 [Planctomycetota bacterium]|jgi:hypothetical protein